MPMEFSGLNEALHTISTKLDSRVVMDGMYRHNDVHLL